MPVIGQFMRENDGFIGHLTTLSLHQDIIIVAAEPSDAENAPDYRIHLDNADGPDIGGAWKRVGERAGDYIALEIDSPLFPALFRPALFQADDEGRTFRLAWKRPRAREDRG